MSKEPKKPLPPAAAGTKKEGGGVGGGGGVFPGDSFFRRGLGLSGFGGGEVYSFVILIIGLLRILYAMAFQEVISTKAEYSGAMADDLKNEPAAAGLPPAQTAPAGDYFPSRANTAEFAEVPSVTENTTNLLSKADNET